MIEKDIVAEIKQYISKQIMDIFSEEYVDELIIGILFEIKEKTYNLKFIDEDSLKVFKNRVNDRLRKTKSRWYKLFNNNEELISKEVSGYKHILEESPSKFVDIFKVKTLNELQLRIKDDLAKWESDSNTLLHHYRYIDIKQNRYIKMALSNDIEFLIYNKILGQENIIVNDIMKMPNAFAVPIDYTNKNRINVKEDSLSKNISDNNYIVDTYKIDDNTIFQSLIGMEEYKKNFVNHFMKTINEMDFSVLMGIINMANDDFFVSRQVVSTMRNILLSIGRPDNPHNYKMLKESLYKIHFIRLRVIDENSRGFTFQIVDNVDIYTEGNIEYVSMIFNIDIIKQIMENKITSLYKKDIENFELSMSKILIYALQKERIKLSSMKLASLKKKVSLNYFRQYVYFRDSRRPRNIKAVEAALNEIISNKITLKSFQRVGESFMLEFYPLTQREMKDFKLTGQLEIP